MKRRTSIKKIRELNATDKSLKKYIKEEQLDENGRAIVEIYAEKDNLYNPFCNPDNPRLSDELYDYIYDECIAIPIKYPVKFIIHTNEDYENIKSQMKYKFWKYASLTDKKIKRSNKISLRLLFIGIILLATYLVLSQLKTIDSLYVELFSITANFSIWEAFDYGILNKFDLNTEYYAYARAAIAEYEFVPLKGKKQ